MKDKNFNYFKYINKYNIFKWTTNRKEYNCIIIKELYPPYWDDGMNFYPRYNPGTKQPNKRIESYQYRRYRTWKYNRKNQWKPIKNSKRIFIRI